MLSFLNFESLAMFLIEKHVRQYFTDNVLVIESLWKLFYVLGNVHKVRTLCEKLYVEKKRKYWKSDKNKMVKILDPLSLLTPRILKIGLNFQIYENVTTLLDLYQRLVFVYKFTASAHHFQGMDNFWPFWPPFDP